MASSSSVVSASSVAAWAASRRPPSIKCGVLVWRPESEQTLWVRFSQTRGLLRGSQQPTSDRRWVGQYRLPCLPKLVHESNIQCAARALRCATAGQEVVTAERLSECVRWTQHVHANNRRRDETEQRIFILVLLDSSPSDVVLIERLTAASIGVWRSVVELCVIVKYERLHASWELHKVLHALPIDRSYRRIPRAGVIPWDPARRRVLVIQGHGDLWGLAKGGAEDHETLHVTAKRELFEETGIDLPLTTLRNCVRISTKCGKVQHYLFLWVTGAPPDHASELAVDSSNSEVRRATWVSYARLLAIARAQVRHSPHDLLMQLCQWLELV
jgi:8-oxo-dGTP pyrophosphatase MutT (NUDIX family)